MICKIMKKPHRITLWILLAVCALSLMSCSLPEEEIRAEHAMRDPDAVNYQTVRAEKSMVTVLRSLNVSVVPVRDEVLRFTASRKQELVFGEILVKKGESVTEGQVLARLDTGDLDEKLQALQEKVTETEKDLSVLDRRHELQKQKNEILFSSYPWAERVRETERAEREYQAERVLLTDALEFDGRRVEELTAERDLYEIRAPFDGKIVSVYNGKKGEKYRSGMKVIEIADLSLPLLRAETERSSDFSEGTAYEMLVGDETEEVYVTDGVKLGYPPKAEESGLPYVYFMLSRQRSDLTNQKTYEIRYETTGSDEALTVPSSVVYRSADQYYVYCRNEQGLPEIRYIAIGARNEERTEVLSGLSEGEEVLE